MNALQTFSFESTPIRVYGTPDEPLFVAADICKALNIDNPSSAVSRLDDDERSSLILNEGKPGNPEVNAVNEAGLYHLIMASRKPEAKPFRRWVIHEVLPSIRKYGSYATDPDVRQLIELITKKKKLLANRDQLNSELRLCEADMRQIQRSMTQPKALTSGVKGTLVTKDDVAGAYHSGEPMEKFKGASNWRSVRRWWEKLHEGGTL